jgi:hypothetical protein
MSECRLQSPIAMPPQLGLQLARPHYILAEHQSAANAVENYHVSTAVRRRWAHR